MSKSEGFIPRVNPRRNTHRTIAAGLFAVVALLVIEYRSSCCSVDNPSLSSNTKPPQIIAPVVSVFTEHRKTDPTYPLPGFIAEQLPTGSANNIRNELMQRAADAVKLNDRKALGQNLALLGAAALSENELSNARVYLDEALTVYEEQDDALGIGSVELLRSRVETVARENARDAASAHDVMQVAAWMTVNNRFNEAEQPVQSAIAENLRLNRYGAAAAGYESLMRGYRSLGDEASAVNATKEALRLHAASGRGFKARALLEQLQTSGLTLDESQQLQQDIVTAEREFESSVLEVQRARDYEQLYRSLIVAGDPVQAWTFRQKANASMAQASKRAMHKRQTGIVALLYNSNDNKRAAMASLNRARALFSDQNQVELLNHIDSAEQLIW